MSNPFRYFSGSPEIIRLAVLMYVKYPLSLRNVEVLLAERGCVARYANPRSSPYATCAHHSANAAERLCL